MRFIQECFRSIFTWYQRHYLAVLVITTAVFLLQIYHLYWLLTDVVLQKLTGTSYYVFTQGGALVSIVADYLEIPTLLSASLLYANALRQKFTWRSVGYLLLLNSQWAHILWITDEVVLETVAATGLLHWNAAVAWVAILIDFLEVPVIVDTLGQVWKEREEIWSRVTHRLTGSAYSSHSAQTRRASSTLDARCRSADGATRKARGSGHSWTTVG